MTAKHSKAIVTLAIGPGFREQFRRFCESNWRRYADVHGYDVICIDHPLDTSKRAQARSAAWQKCLVLSQDDVADHERVVWIDSDIFINNASAPDVCESVPIDKVGAVDMYSSPTPALYAELLERMYEYWRQLYGPIAIENRTAREYYTRWGLPYGFDAVANTGVLVMSPRHHRELLEKVYYEYEEKSQGGRGVWHMEQRPLSWELMNAGVLHWLDWRFNVNWWELQFLYYPFLLNARRPSFSVGARLTRNVKRVLGYEPRRKLRAACVNAAFAVSYFLHFTGGADASGDIGLLDLEQPSWRRALLDAALSLLF